MKNQMIEKFHDVSTYVKSMLKRTYGECAIVMMGTLLLVLSSVSTDSMNMESEVDTVEAAVITADASAELTSEAVMVTDRRQTRLRFLAEKAAEENAIALAKKNAMEKPDATTVDSEETVSDKAADANIPSTPAEEETAAKEPEMEAASADDLTGVIILGAESDVNPAASEDIAAVLSAAEAAMTEEMTAAEMMVTETPSTEISATEVIPAEVTAAEATALDAAELDAAALETTETEAVVIEEAVTEVSETEEIAAEETTAVNTCGLSASEYEALCKIVQAEAGGEGEQGKMLVASVVLNRVAHPSFPGNVESVITQEDQFSPVSNGSYQRSLPDTETMSAVNRVLSGENVAAGALYFKSVHSSADWNNRTLLYSYGNHNFYQ